MDASHYCSPRSLVAALKTGPSTALNLDVPVMFLVRYAWLSRFVAYLVTWTPQMGKLIGTILGLHHCSNGFYRVSWQS